MSQTRMVLVGGFLGAGKTTLLTRAAKLLAGQGKVVGVITNDQAAQLVDTGALKEAGLAVEEVAGGCFCCRFDELVLECNRIVDELSPDVVLGEPVGSCTDISATVLQPMKALHAERWQMAPFTVLTDPVRLRDALSPETSSAFPEPVLYIFRKQLEEADLIAINKCDLLGEEGLLALEAAVAKEFAGTPVLRMSALRGDGVADWMNRVLQGERAGAKVVEVDYDTYAEGEAVLGWLNAFATVRAEDDVDWGAFCLDLLERIQGECRARRAEIAHAKLLLSAPGGHLMANLTATNGKALLQGALPPGTRAGQLTINARVGMDPETLRAVVEACLAAAAGEAVHAEVTHLANFSPARPTPVHRFASVV